MILLYDMSQALYHDYMVCAHLSNGLIVPIKYHNIKNTTPKSEEDDLRVFNDEVITDKEFMDATMSLYETYEDISITTISLMSPIVKTSDITTSINYESMVNPYDETQTPILRIDTTTNEAMGLMLIGNTMKMSKSIKAIEVEERKSDGEKKKIGTRHK